MHMKRLFIILYCLFTSIDVWAQVVSSWHTYTQNNSSSRTATQSTIIDNNGDYYVILTLSSARTEIDSAGSTIFIDSIPAHNSCIVANSKQTAIIKYTKNHQYLYHLRFYSVSDPSNCLLNDLSGFTQRNIDSANNLILTFSGVAPVLYFYNINRSVYQQINLNVTPNNFYIFNVSLNENGQYNWINYLNLKNWKLNQSFNIQFTRIVGNKLHTVMNSTVNTPSQDTITIFKTGATVSNQIYTIHKGSVSFWCNLDGYFLHTTSPYSHYNTANITVAKTSVVSHDSLIYRLMVYDSKLSDTIVYTNGVRMPLDIGYNYVLENFKNDSLFWVKKIYSYNPIIGFNYNDFHRISYDIKKKQIITMMTFIDTNEIFYENISKPAIIFSAILKFDSSGNLVNQINVSNNFGNNVLPEFLLYNPIKESFSLICLNNYGININGIPFIEENNFLTAPYYIEFNSANKVINISRLNTAVNSIGSRIIVNTSILQDNINYDISNNDNTIIPYYLSSNDTIWSKCKGYLTNKQFRNYANVLILNTDKYEIDTSVCYTYLSPSGKLLDSTGFYLDTFTVTGSTCKEIAYINLSVRNSKRAITQTHCGNKPSPSGRFVMDTTGVYKDTLVNQFGCDSLLTINFTQLRKTDTTLRDTLVCSFFITQQGDTLRSNTNVTDTLQTTLGCDSIVRYRLIIGDSTAVIDTTICDSYQSPSGKVFLQSGSYADTVAKANGCRLYYTINITKTSLNITVDTAVCNNFTAPSGKIFTAPGNYLDTIASARGCDSIITFRITKGATLQLIDTAICNNYISPSGKLNLNSAGLYFDTIVSTTGCDSVFEIRLTLDTFSVRITKSNDLTCETPTITLSADAGNSFVWSPTDFLSAANLQTVVASPQAAMQYKLTAYNATGCEATDSIAIEDKRVEIILTIPNVFTPDGDKVNDDFGVDPQEDVAEMSLQVFNRWGAMVFESNAAQNRWLGNADNGNECTPGVYYYIAKGKDRCGKPFEATGTVSLIR